MNATLCTGTDLDAHRCIIPTDHVCPDIRQLHPHIIPIESKLGGFFINRIQIIGQQFCTVRLDGRAKLIQC